MFRFLLALTIFWLTSLAAINCADHFIATQLIQAEDYSSGTGFAVASDCPAKPNATYVSAVSGHDDYTLQFAQVEFGLRVDTLTVRLSNASPDTTPFVYCHLNSLDGPTFLVLTVAPTGTGNCEFTTVDFALDPPLSGVHDLYLTTSTSNPGLNFDWLVFSSGAPRMAMDMTEAEDYNSARGVKTFSDCPDDNVRYIEAKAHSSWLVYYQLDFGGGAEMVTLRLSNWNSDLTLYVALHLDSVNSAPFVTIPVGKTGSQLCDFFTLDQFLDNRPSGVHDLVVSFPGQVSGALRIDWLVFNQSVVSN